MKVKIGRFHVDLNESVIKKKKKAVYVAQMVKSLAWTGISPEMLENKLSEVYDMVKAK